MTDAQLEAIRQQHASMQTREFGTTLDYLQVGVLLAEVDRLRAASGRANGGDGDGDGELVAIRERNEARKAAFAGVVSRLVTQPVVEQAIEDIDRLLWEVNFLSGVIADQRADSGLYDQGLADGRRPVEKLLPLLLWAVDQLKLHNEEYNHVTDPKAIDSVIATIEGMASR